MEMTPKQVEQWTKTREMGRSRYIWRHGVWGWGLVVGLFWAVAMAAVQGWDRLPILIPVSLIAFPIGGYFFGAWTWKMTEAKYQRANREIPVEE